MFHPVRSLIFDINWNRRQVLRPGAKLCFDEFIDPWEGVEHKHDANGAPGISKILRKPRPIGHEFIALMDGLTNITYQIELCEGKERMKDKPFVSQYGPSTAHVLRLCNLEELKPNVHGERCVVFDSAFGSVKTCIATHQEIKMRSMMMVKTAHKLYPLNFLKDWHDDLDMRTEEKGGERGAHLLFQSSYTIRRQVGEEFKDEEHNLYACGWGDRKLKTILTNCGSSEKADPFLRPRSRNILETTEKTNIKIPCIMLIRQFFEFFSNVDISDHYRQGTLAPHESLHTRNWVYRLFTTLHALTIVDAYFAYCYERRDTELEVMKFIDFVDEIAYELIHNTIDEKAGSRKMTTRGAGVGKKGGGDAEVPIYQTHALRPLAYDFPATFNSNGNNRLRCSKCQKHTSHYCVGCHTELINNGGGKSFIGICNPSTGQDNASTCWYEHLNDINDKHRHIHKKK